MENKVIESNLKEVRLMCPICNQQIKMRINTEAVAKKKHGVVAFSTIHCGKVIIAHVDQNMVVRSVESAISTHDITENIGMSAEEMIEKIYPSIQGEITREECTYYFCNRDCAKRIRDIPNIIEKHMLKVVHDDKGVNLKSLKEHLHKVEKAYNMSFSYSHLEQLLEKYVKDGLIVKEVFE